MIGSFMVFFLRVYFCGFIPRKQKHDANCAFHYVCQGGHVFSPVCWFLCLSTELREACADFHETWWQGVAWGRKNPLNLKVDPNHEVAIQIIFHFYRMSIGFSRRLPCLTVNQEREWR